MAKKIVRGITDVKTINNQDFDTNNVNDLLSDGQYNYIHRKKGESEEYHNLTDNIKTLSSDNTDLLTVTNNNKTTNTATLHPKHDAQKEQLLESTRNTISIHHGENGTAEKTTVDTNPLKVLEHENLISDSEFITLNHQPSENTTHIQTAKLKEKLDNLQQNKQDTLVAGRGIRIVGHTISAIADVTFYTGEDYRVLKQVTKYATGTFVTFTFDCQPQFTERELTGYLKSELIKFVQAGMTVSNGAVTITYDGTNMKLTNNKSPEVGSQQGIFTFHEYTGGGGGGPVGS